MGNMNKLCKLLCTHCLNSLMDFAFCMIICISMSWIYDFIMEKVNWSKYLTTCKSCDFIISKMRCFCQITNLWAHFPLKWETWVNFVSYSVQIVSTLHCILYSVLLFIPFFLLVRPPRSQSLLIMGWCSSIPEHRLWITLDSVPIV